MESLLDQMNRAGDDINRLETALANARRHYLHVGGETERQCQQVAKGLKRNIRQSSLYYHKKVRRVRLRVSVHCVFGAWYLWKWKTTPPISMLWIVPWLGVLNPCLEVDMR